MLNQLVLPVSLREDATFANFLPGPNTILLRYLQTLEFGQLGKYLYYWGGSGVGGTHLLHACCHNAHQRGLTTVYLPLAEFEQLTPAVLEGLETLNVICLDDIHLIAGNNSWEEALFGLYNRIMQQGNYLIIASKRVPLQLGLNLADLTSRLNNGLIFSLQELSDEEKALVLQRRARQQGVELSSEVSRYLLQRVSRNLATLIKLLERLEQASLAAQRKITIPFVRAILALAPS